MFVNRTLDQLKSRRHAFLALLPQTKQERQFQRVDPEEEVGCLKGMINGKKRALIVTLGQDFWIGHRPECDVVLDSPTISSFHVRIYAVRTSCKQSLICLHDLSSNGFTLNGTPYQVDNPVQIGDQSVCSRSVVLLPGDVLTFPDSGFEVKCHYYSRHSEATQALQTSQIRPRFQVMALFPSSDPSLQHAVSPWVIQNFTLGTGSFGRVHLAAHGTVTTVQVACKTISLDFDIQTEIAIMSRIKHANLCGIYDMVKEESAKVCHLFLPLVTGGDLFSYMEKHGTLTEDECKFAALQMVKALDYLHDKGIAHRDVKPENILLHRSGAYPHLLLADFGLAITREKVMTTVPYDRTQTVERPTDKAGTVIYLPPERLKKALNRKRTLNGLAESLHGGIVRWREEIGARWFDEEVTLDIWALGVVLYYMLVGVHPYDESTDPDADGEDDDDAGPSNRAYTRMSSAHSWDVFRSRNAHGTVGDGPTWPEEEEWRKVSSRCARFTKLRSDQWHPAEDWTEISVEARNFVAGLLAYHPTKRLSMQTAASQSWFEVHQAELDAMYETVVVQGKLGRSSIWNFNDGEPPLKKSIEPTRAVAEKAKAKAAEAVKTVKSGGAGTPTKASTDPSIASSKTKLSTATKASITAQDNTQKKAETPRRPPSLFLPSSGIFSQPLDDIAEEEEMLGGVGKNGHQDEEEGESSGSGEGNAARNHDNDETFPPVKAGTRKDLGIKTAKVGAAFTLASKLTTVSFDEDNIRPSDLASTLQPAVKKARSNFQAPTIRRPGVVLTRKAQM